MNMHKIVLISAIALAFAAAVAIIKPRAARSDTITVLSPGGWFTVPAADNSWSTDGFRAVDGHLYFLLRTGPMETPPRSAIIETDTRGGLVHRLDIQGARVEAFDVEKSGRIMARVREGDIAPRRPQALMIWDGYGLLQRRVENVPAGGAIVFHAGRSFSLTETGLLPLDPSLGGGAITVAPSLGQAAALTTLPLSDDETAIMSRLTASLTVIENNSVIRHIQLQAPEIQGVRRATDQGELTFFAEATDDQQHIFAGVTPFKGDAGPTILEFTDMGDILHRYRAAPAVLAQLHSSKNPGGVASPRTFAVTRGELFFISGAKSNSTVIWYSLPE